MLFLLVIGTLTLAFDIRPTFAQAETIYINADGSITPSTAPIYTADNVTYAFTGNISYPAYNGIIVERSNTMIDGNGYTVQGNQSGCGLSLTDISNVTVQNASVQGFGEGMQLLSGSNNNTICGNNVTANSAYGIYLYGSSYNTISGNNVTANDEGDGIVFSYSSFNTVSENDATANSYGDGIYLYSSSNNAVSGNNATADYCGIYLSDSSNNTVNDNTATADYNPIYLFGSVDNNVSGNTVANGEGIYLLYGSSFNTISGNTAMDAVNGILLYYSADNAVSENTLASNVLGLRIVSSSNNMMYYNSFVGNTAQASVDSTSVGNTWDNGYPSGGNYWSDYNGTDIYCGAYQNQTGSDGIGDTPYVIDANNTDNYPLMNPWVSPDIAVTGLTLGKTVIGQGYSGLVNVTFENLGNKIEGFNATVYANSTFILSEQTMLGMTNCTLSFLWNTTGFAYGNYTMSAYALPAPGETNSVNNNFTGGWVIVSMVGDITGPNGWPDGKVDMRDLAIVARAFGSDGANYLYPGSPPSSNWNPNADINGDGTVNMKDIALVARNFGQHYP